MFRFLCNLRNPIIFAVLSKGVEIFIIMCQQRAFVDAHCWSFSFIFGAQNQQSFAELKMCLKWMNISTLHTCGCRVCWTTQCSTNQMTYKRSTTSSSLSCTLSLAVFQSLWQVCKGRRKFSVFRETRASINHICLCHVQILDIASLPSSIFTLFECKCSEDKPMCCHKSGLGSLPTSSSNYWGGVQCLCTQLQLQTNTRSQTGFSSSGEDLPCPKHTHTYANTCLALHWISGCYFKSCCWERQK